ncbi:chlororespiratory reduction protein 7 [cf. Phormidesmis sp. LEGE 11477]|uniref:chlororespiratory reduction protein 7 n=1 Tax=cf. Phormidesmis sp. LEGE 11477 TaxID=1828680 RepID=UPI0018818A12|nr:chlororespiratory reduction protein 7 [cf. Phormidesmis sp. LEGE 11477]MBE9061639.1 chlororespiratory reduction protein 7 [cf. Phormidesmis sp. LEGE 11477]
MADALLYDEEMFVFLTPDATETFLTPDELLAKLKEVLATYVGELPRELTKMTSAEAQAKYLIETRCEFETAPGESIQWYAVRLEK